MIEDNNSYVESNRNINGSTNSSMFQTNHRVKLKWDKNEEPPDAKSIRKWCAENLSGQAVVYVGHLTNEYIVSSPNEDDILLCKITFGFR